MKPEPEIWIDSGKYSRWDEVIISRTRLGLTLLTHGYLVNNDVAPYGKLCINASLSLEVYKRNRAPNIGELLGRNIRISEILLFLRNIGAHDLI